MEVEPQTRPHLLYFYYFYAASDCNIQSIDAI